MAKKISDQLLLETANTSASMSDTVRKLGLKYSGGQHHRYKERLERLGFDFSLFAPNKQPTTQHRKPIEELLVVYACTSSVKNYRIKKRLYEEGLKEKKCEWCGIKDWRGKPLKLELDHIDGNNCNYQITNLRLLCPNCHSQTPTHSKVKQE